MAQQTQEIDEREKEELSKVIKNAKRHKYHGGLDNFIDVQSSQEIDNMLTDNSATLLNQ